MVLSGVSLIIQQAEAGRIDDKLVQFEQVASGTYHTCALTEGGWVYCWGNATNGALGNGAASGYFTTPVPVSQGAIPAGVTVTSISAGTAHTCAIGSNNQTYCWGNGANGRLGNNTTNTHNTPIAVLQGEIPAGVTVQSIAAGNAHTCAIGSNSHAYCWGAGGGGRLGNDSTGNQLTPVSVLQGEIPAGVTLQSISAGTAHTCAVGSNNRAYCWGSGTNGVVGNGAVSGSFTTPVAVDTTGPLANKTVTSMTTGTSHTCAIADSAAYCWGNGTNGRLGNGEASGTFTTPVAVDASGALVGKTSVAVAVGIGSTSTCAIADSAAYCWGNGANGRLGNGEASGNFTTPVAVTVPSEEQTAGFEQTGYRVYQSSASSTLPGAPLAAENTAATLTAAGDSFRLRTGVQAMPRFSKIDGATGGTHTCAIAEGAAYCWGSNFNGRLGDGTTIHKSSPVPVDASGVLAGKTVTDIAVGMGHACAIADGAVYCWGSGSGGQLGNGLTTEQLTPVAVLQGEIPAGATVTAVTAGNSHTCAIADGAAYCWGAGFNGRLGTGATSSRTSPAAVDISGVIADKTVTSIAAGSAHTCAIADGAAYCWGSATNMVLGNGAVAGTFSSPVAVRASGVLSNKTVTDITASSSHTCAIADGAAYCWGSGADGRLGNGGTAASATPAAVDASGALAGKTAVAITVGGTFTCAVADDAAYCWGSNLGTTGSTSIPVAVDTSGVLAGKDVAAISAGNNHVCALADTAAYCWGTNTYGAVGDGSTASRSAPVSVVKEGINGPSIPASVNQYRLMYAQKTAPTCREVSGWQVVTNTTAIGYASAAGVVNGTTIQPGANDPSPSNSTAANQMMTLRSSEGVFTNPTRITAGNVALFDFALRDNATPNTTYCLSLEYGTGDRFESYSHYPLPEVTTGGMRAVGFVDNAGAPVSLPSFAFPPATANATQMTTRVGDFSSGSQKLRVNNSAFGAWTVYVAATNGSNATWMRGATPAYSYSGTPEQGQLQLNPSAATLSAVAAPGGNATTCSAYGSTVTRGPLGSFAPSATSLTLLSGSASAPINCYYDLVGVYMRQTIPAGVEPGSYSLDLTATVVAQ